MRQFVDTIVTIYYSLTTVLHATASGDDIMHDKD